MNILVIGAGGYLGSTIYTKLKENGKDKVYGTCHRSEDPELLKIDVMKQEDIEFILSYKPQVIIWSIYDFERERTLSGTGLKQILEAIQKDVRFIYVSTTVGTGKDQTEDTIPQKRSPEEYLSEYVNGKIEGEELVKEHANHVIVRPGSIYGYDCRGNMDARMKKLMKISKSRDSYSRTVNMYASFVHVQDLAEAIIELSHGAYSGIINIAGEKPVSHYEFNIKLCKLMNIDSSFITADYKPEAVYHSLNSSKRKNSLNTLIRDL